MNRCRTSTIPFPVYASLRDHDPVHWSRTLNGWVVTRFADVIEIFRRPGRFASDRFRNVPGARTDRTTP